MNLLFLSDTNLVSVDRTVLHNRRLKRLHEAHRTESGNTLWVGRLGGQMGEGRLLKLDTSEATLEVCFNQPPSAKLPIAPLLALSRPEILRQVLQTIVAMDVPKLVLLNNYRVEKSFWQTPFLNPTAVCEDLVLGLEQVHDTALLEVIVKRRFKPFVEDHLLALAASNLSLVSHPGPWPACPRAVEKPVTLAIGPEGGWIPYEVNKLHEAGLHPVQLDGHILRVGIAISALLTWLS